MTKRPAGPFGLQEARHWRSCGDHPLPTGREALDEPFSAFPSWFLRIVCGRCGGERMISETHFERGDMLIREILDRAGKAELLPASTAYPAGRCGGSW